MKKRLKWPEYDLECSVCGYCNKASKFGKHNHNEFYLLPIAFVLFIIGVVLVKILV